MAEAIFEWFVVQSNDDRISAPGEIVRIGIDALHHDLVQLAQRVDVTGAHPNDDSRVNRVLYLLVPALVAQVIGSQIFSEGDEEVLGRGIGAGVVHLKLIEVVELQEAVDLIAVCIPISPLGTDHLIVLHQPLDHLSEVALGDSSIEHV